MLPGRGICDRTSDQRHSDNDIHRARVDPPRARQQVL
jgi:hypothetical protein